MHLTFINPVLEGSPRDPHSIAAFRIDWPLWTASIATAISFSVYDFISCRDTYDFTDVARCPLQPRVLSPLSQHATRHLSSTNRYFPRGAAINLYPWIITASFWPRTLSAAFMLRSLSSRQRTEPIATIRLALRGYL